MLHGKRAYTTSQTRRRIKNPFTGRPREGRKGGSNYAICLRLFPNNYESFESTPLSISVPCCACAESNLFPRTKTAINGKTPLLINGRKSRPYRNYAVYNVNGRTTVISSKLSFTTIRPPIVDIGVACSFSFRILARVYSQKMNRKSTSG